MSKFSEFEAFSAVMTEGSFRGAARNLGLTPSAVSKQVRALEERLGARLLNRTTRQVAPTDAGLAFRERLRVILDDVEEAEFAVTALQAEPRGRLRVNVPMDFGRRHLVEPLARFAAAHPAIDLDVELGDRRVDPIEEGFDVVVRIGALAESTLVARWLGPCRRVLCASPGYLGLHGLPKTPGDLHHHVRVGFAHEAQRAWNFRAADGRETRVTVPARHATNSGEMLRALLIAGQGIALTPTFLVADDLRSGRLRTFLADAVDADVSIHAVYPHRRYLSAKVRAVVDFLVAVCGPEPPWDEGLAP